jgi:hypothetical protein
MTEINKKIEDELDRQFPKGDKARGKALVLVAIAQLELEKSKRDFFKFLKTLDGRYLEALWEKLGADADNMPEYEELEDFVCDKINELEEELDKER